VREYGLIGFAALQATLHNRWYERPDGRKFTPADFMPGSHVAPDDRSMDQRIEDQKMGILAALQMAAVFNGEVN
jgi:hypothetical protein